MINQDSILIVGGGPQALFLLRELSRLKFEVIIIAMQNEIALASKYGKKILIRDESELIQKLKEIIDSHKVSSCIIASGHYLAFLIQHFQEIFTMLNTWPTPLKDVEILYRKKLTYNLATNIGILCPETHWLIEFYEHQKYETSIYPKFVKWSKDISLKKAEFKTMVIRSKTDFLDFYANLCDYERESLIIQEFLNSDLSNNFSYGGWFEEGKLKYGICVNEVRHYKSGISSIVMEYDGPYSAEIKEKSCNLIASTNFTGFLDVEFILNQDKLYLLEVNPRPFGFMKILKKKYPNIVKSIMRIEAPELVHPNKVIWMNLIKDFICVLRQPKGLFNHVKYVFSFRNRIFDILDLKDIKPFFAQLRIK